MVYRIVYIAMASTLIFLRFGIVASRTNCGLLTMKANLLNQATPASNPGRPSDS